MFSDEKMTGATARNYFFKKLFFQVQQAFSISTSHTKHYQSRN